MSAIPQPVQARRTEREQAANTVVLLMRAGFIISPVAIRRLCATVGVSTRDLAEARDRLPGGTDNDLKPRAWAQCEPEPAPEPDTPTVAVAAPASWTPQPSGSQRNTIPKQVKAKNPEPGKRRCNRCKEVLAVTEFDKLNVRKNQLRSDCRNCRKKYSRARYLTVRRAAAIDVAIAYFTAIESDAVIGMTCPCCNDPIGPGDRISFEARPRHASCNEDVAAMLAGQDLPGAIPG